MTHIVTKVTSAARVPRESGECSEKLGMEEPELLGANTHLELGTNSLWVRDHICSSE